MSGTFGLASGLLGEKCDNAFFKVVAVVDAVVVLLFWFIVSFNCLVGAIDGKLFFGERPRRDTANGQNGSKVRQKDFKATSASDLSTKVNSDV